MSIDSACMKEPSKIMPSLFNALLSVVAEAQRSDWHTIQLDVVVR